MQHGGVNVAARSDGTEDLPVDLVVEPTQGEEVGPVPHVDHLAMRLSVLGEQKGGLIDAVEVEVVWQLVDDERSAVCPASEA